MKKRLFKIIKHTVAIACIFTGVVLLWGKRPLLGLLLSVTGICLLDSLYRLLRLQRRWWKWCLPLLFVIFTVIAFYQPQRHFTRVFKPEEAPVYVTPSGTKYHLRATCAGKNAIQRTRAQIAEEDYTPCANCAKEK